MTRRILRHYGDCPTHGPSVEFRCNGHYYCGQCADAWTARVEAGERNIPRIPDYRPDHRGRCPEINLRTIDTPARVTSTVPCNGRCTSGKHACECHCGGRCHGAGRCFCGEPAQPELF